MIFQFNDESRYTVPISLIISAELNGSQVLVTVMANNLPIIKMLRYSDKEYAEADISKFYEEWNSYSITINKLEAERQMGYTDDIQGYAVESEYDYEEEDCANTRVIPKGQIGFRI